MILLMLVDVAKNGPSEYACVRPLIVAKKTLLRRDFQVVESYFLEDLLDEALDWFGVLPKEFEIDLSEFY